MLPQLRAYLLDNWSSLAVGRPRPRCIEFLVQATGVSKICCYTFIDDEAQPRWVAKAMRSCGDNAVLAREYAIIEHVRHYDSKFINATVPGPLTTVNIAGHLVGFESYLPGQPMDGHLRHASNLRGREILSALDRGLDWLVRSQNETSTCHAPLADDQLESQFFRPISRFQKYARLTNVERIYLDDLRKRIAALSAYPLPLGFVHGDFQPGNILLEPETFKVIDWEFGAVSGLPFLDVFSFIARIYARCHGLEEIDGYLEDYLQAFDHVFFEGGEFAPTTAKYVQRACEGLNIRPEWVDVLFPMFLIHEANKYFAFLSQRAERGYVYLLRDRSGRVTGSYGDQLSRQKNVWLLSHLVGNAGRVVFRI